MAFFRDVEPRSCGVVLTATPEDEETGQHANACEAKAVFKAVRLSHKGHHSGGEEGADVDADVEDGEARVAAGIVVFVELSNDGGDVRLEEAVSDNQRTHAKEHEHFTLGDGVRTANGASHHQEFSDGHEDGTEENGVAVAEVLVGHFATENGGCVNQGRVGTVDEGGVRVAFQEGFDKEQRQEHAHAVVAKTLPHLREEEGHQALRMPCGKFQLGHEIRYFEGFVCSGVGAAQKFSFTKSIIMLKRCNRVLPP